MRAYASHDTVEATKRKLPLYSLWLSAGRTNECCFLSFDSLRWDAHFGAVQVEIIQFKTSKAKKVAFTAGPNADRCWFTHLGDMLAMETNELNSRRGQSKVFNLTCLRTPTGARSADS